MKRIGNILIKAVDIIAFVLPELWAALGVYLVIAFIVEDRDLWTLWYVDLDILGLLLLGLGIGGGYVLLFVRYWRQQYMDLIRLPFDRWHNNSRIALDVLLMLVGEFLLICPFGLIGFMPGQEYNTSAIILCSAIVVAAMGVPYLCIRRIVQLACVDKLLSPPISISR